MEKAQQKSHLISLERENQDSQEQIADLSFEVALKECRAMLNLKVFSYGCSIRPEEECFFHATPIFCRIFLFLRKGGRIRIDGRETELVPGKIYLLSDNHPFEVCYYAGSELLYAHISVTDYTYQSVFSEAAGLLDIDIPELIPMMKRGWDHQDSMKICALLGTVLAEFLPSVTPLLLHRYEIYRHFGPVFRHLSENKPANLRISELADLMGMSPSAFSKSFAHHVGCSPKEYILAIYLRRARELLIYSNLNMKDIAEELGHADVHYFYHLFKRFTGISPARFRKQNTGSQIPHQN